MKISMEIITTVEFEIAADKYPAGMSPDVALALEIEQASQDPHEYVAMQGAVTSVVGQLVRDNGQPLRMRDRLRWGAGDASSHWRAAALSWVLHCNSANWLAAPKGHGEKRHDMSKFAINRSNAAEPMPKVIVEADGRVVADLETFSARHAELVSCDLALLATRLNPAATVVVHPPLDPDFCEPKWGRRRQLLASDQRLGSS
jgi:hypothetical protein